MQKEEMKAWKGFLLSSDFSGIVAYRFFFLFSILFSIIGLIQRLPLAYGVGSIFGFSGSKVLRSLPLFLTLWMALLGLVLLETHCTDVIISISQKLVSKLKGLKKFNWVIWFSLIFAFGFFNLFPVSLPLLADIPLIWLFGHIALFGVLILKAGNHIELKYSFIVTFSGYGLILWMMNHLPRITSYPLTIGWSEASRYYYASLLLPQRVYSASIPLSSFLPARYLMQAIPFIIPTLPVWFHRFWEVLFWVVSTFVGGLALTKRIKPKNFWLGLGLATWFTLFVYQGPVYFHLMVVVIIVLLGFNKAHLGRSIVYVGIASLWAGLTRINWFPVAGMLAATIYVLEIPQKNKKFWRYWLWPVIAAVLGFLLAIGAKTIYVMISDQSTEGFFTSLNSPLLWYRLFPNEAFGAGVLLLLIIAIFPLVLIILWRLIPSLQSWRVLRLTALATILIVLLIGGIIVSAKIGGGNNLHNLDAFLVLLGVVTAYLLFNRFVPDDHEQFVNYKIPIVMIILLGLIPAIFLIDSLQPYTVRDHKAARQDIAIIQQLINEEVPEDGEVLFIHNRHLITFGMIEQVELVYEYEKVFLMEMAMSETMQYLNMFQDDIENHRFSMIVTEPLFLGIKPSSAVFAEENNAWVIHIAKPIDQYYQTIFETSESAMSVMVPKSGD